MISESVVHLSRAQFGMTAMYHFIFVPLTLGLSVLLGIMESIYVMNPVVVHQFWTYIHLLKNISPNDLESFLQDILSFICFLSNFIRFKVI